VELKGTERVMFTIGILLLSSFSWV